MTLINPTVAMRPGWYCQKILSWDDFSEYPNHWIFITLLRMKDIDMHGSILV